MVGTTFNPMVDTRHRGDIRTSLASCHTDSTMVEHHNAVYLVDRAIHSRYKLVEWAVDRDLVGNFVHSVFYSDWVYNTCVATYCWHSPLVDTKSYRSTHDSSCQLVGTAIDRMVLVRRNFLSSVHWDIHNSGNYISYNIQWVATYHWNSTMVDPQSDGIYRGSNNQYALDNRNDNSGRSKYNRINISQS